GDAVLRVVAEVLRKSVRTEDIACRYGGEEFVLLMPGAGTHIASERAERVRAAVAAATFVFAGQTLGGFTLSAGVASYPDHGDTAERLIKAADTVLYKAKRSGRNQVITAG
ncbi:MAG: diguanylate cyclase, partial [Gammaproteobacteria bacterium]|nr:diguanylate cyclase [Gammaproteobacteria bacterium]